MVATAEDKETIKTFEAYLAQQALEREAFEQRFEVPDVNIWFQTSRAHRAVARLPEGKTGRQALWEAQSRPMDKTWALQFSEYSAGDHYLRCHAPITDQLTLNRKEFEAYRAAGGDTYQSAWFTKATAQGLLGEETPSHVHVYVRELVSRYPAEVTPAFYDQLLAAAIKLHTTSQKLAFEAFRIEQEVRLRKEKRERDEQTNG